MNRKLLLAIAVGGVAGAAVRLAIIEALPQGASRWGVLIVNVIGSALLGWAATRLRRAGPEDNRTWWLALSSGFCGSLTTLSSLVVEIAEDLREGALSSGLGYVAISVMLGAAAVWLGHRLANDSAAGTTS